MRKITLLISLIIFLFVFSGCEYIEAIPDLIPSFESSLPNVFSGKYAYYETEEDSVGSVKKYIHLFEFDNINNTFIHKEAGEPDKKGTFSYSYNEFIITECNGYLTLNYEDGSVERYGFLYQASAVGGPQTLTLRPSSSADLILVYEN